MTDKPTATQKTRLVVKPTSNIDLSCDLWVKTGDEFNQQASYITLLPTSFHLPWAERIEHVKKDKSGEGHGCVTGGDFPILHGRLEDPHGPGGDEECRCDDVGHQGPRKIQLKMKRACLMLSAFKDKQNIIHNNRFHLAVSKSLNSSKVFCTQKYDIISKSSTNFLNTT